MSVWCVKPRLVTVVHGMALDVYGARPFTTWTGTVVRTNERQTRSSGSGLRRATAASHFDDTSRYSTKSALRRLRSFVLYRNRLLPLLRSISFGFASHTIAQCTAGPRGARVHRRIDVLQDVRKVRRCGRARACAYIPRSRIACMAVEPRRKHMN